MTDPTPKTEESKGNLPDNVTKALEEIKAKLENQIPAKEETPPPAGPSFAEQREAMKKTMGYSEEQMQAHEQMILKAQAPVIENTGWNRLEKRSDLETYRKEIEGELALYPQERRTPDIMEKIYYMVKGRHADAKPATTPAKGGSDRVTETRISRGPGYSGSDPGLSGAGSASDDPNDPNKLSEEEKFVANKLGVPLKEYAQSKTTGRSIRELRVPDQRPISSLADVELKRMMGR